MTNGKPSEVKRDSDFSVTVVFPSCRLASKFEREMKARSEDMTNGNSAELKRFEKWIGQKRPDESGMEQYSWDDCLSAWEAALSVCADGGKGALGWTWERRYSNGGYTRKFCTSELEARELAKDGESLSIPDLVYPFFARADGGKGDDQPTGKAYSDIEEMFRDMNVDGGKSEAVYQVQTGDCWLDMTQEQYEQHSKTRPTRVLYAAPQAIGKDEADPICRYCSGSGVSGPDCMSYCSACNGQGGAAPQAECAPRADAATAGASIYERFDKWLKGPHARVQTMLDAFSAGASNGCANADTAGAKSKGFAEGVKDATNAMLAIQRYRAIYQLEDADTGAWEDVDWMTYESFPEIARRTVYSAIPAAGASNERADAEKDAALTDVIIETTRNWFPDRVYQAEYFARAILAANKGKQS